MVGNENMEGNNGRESMEAINRYRINYARRQMEYMKVRVDVPKERLYNWQICNKVLWEFKALQDIY